MAIATYKVMPILGHVYFGLEAASYRLTDLLLTAVVALGL